MTNRFIPHIVRRSHYFILALALVMGGVFLYTLSRLIVDWARDKGEGVWVPGVRMNLPPQQVVYDFIKHARRSRFKMTPVTLSGPQSKPGFDNESEGSAGEPPLSTWEDTRDILCGLPGIDARPASGSPLPVMYVTLGAQDRKVRRKALHSPGASSHEYSMHIPPDAELSFDYGAVGEMRFVVELTERSHKPEIVFSTGIAERADQNASLTRVRVDSALAGTQWYKQTIDLSRWKNKRVRLCFKTEGSADSFQKPGDLPHGFWAGPVLLTNDPLPAKTRQQPNIVLLVVESLGAKESAKIDSAGTSIPHMRRFILEGVDFQKTYSNAVLPFQGLPALLESRIPLNPSLSSRPNAKPGLNQEGTGLSPRLRRAYRRRKNFVSLASQLKKQGYTTVLSGALDFLNGRTDPGADWGFDETYFFSLNTENVRTVCRQAVEWLSAQQSRRPFFLVIYLGDPFLQRKARHQTIPWISPPLHFWTQTFQGFPLTPDTWARWHYRTHLTHMDHHLGQFFDALERLDLWDDSLIGLVSLHGQSFRKEPVKVIRKNGTEISAPWEKKQSPGVGLREEEVRIQWTLKYKSLPAGRMVSDTAQLLDVAPTLLKTLKQPIPSSFEGLAFDLFKKKTFSRTGSHPRILIFGNNSKALLLDSQIKYIRRAQSDLRTVFSKRLYKRQWVKEELYDLHTDPQESFNLVRNNRTLLGTVRRAMNDSEPDRAKTGLIFWDLKGKRVRGVVTSPGGDLWNVESSGSVIRRGSNQISFEIKTSSGYIHFETWPPSAYYILRLWMGRQLIMPPQARVSKLGLPLFERTVDQWYDRNRFPWLEGQYTPVPSDKGPLVFFSRQAVQME